MCSSGCQFVQQSILVEQKMAFLPLKEAHGEIKTEHTGYFGDQNMCRTRQQILLEP